MKQLFESILKVALERQAQDFYLLPAAEYLIKFHDGHCLTEYQTLTSDETKQLSTFIKYQAQMNVVESRRPQLGSFSWSIDGVTHYLRVSTVAYFRQRETIVVRIMNEAASQMNWLDSQQYDRLMRQMSATGLVVLSGPTGSGKTSTIHQMIRQISQDKLVLSVEDLVEIQAEDIVQLQVNEQADMDYQALIKVALRHHPDILVIGEIRDEQAAMAAMRAALSGHLVLTTVHAQSTRGIQGRLLELGLDPQLLDQVLKGLIYQRLIVQQNEQRAAYLDLVLNQEIQLLKTDFSVHWQKGLENAFREQRIDEQTKNFYQAL